MSAITKKALEVKEIRDSATTADSDSDSGLTSEEQANETRRKNLLGRDRGIFGTVQTGFRGLLSLAQPFGQRKTLLGE